MLAHVNQNKSSLQLFAVQNQLDLPTGKLFLGGQIILGFVGAFVPYHHRTRAIVPLGNHTFKVRVFQWMVLGHGGKAFAGWVHTGSLGHGPGHQHTINFQSEVVVQPRGVMLLNHKAAAFASPDTTSRLGSLTKLPFSAIFFECH